MKLGFDADEGAEHCRRLAHATASVQVKQIINGKNVYKILQMRTDPLRCFLQTPALVPKAYCLMHHQSFAQGGTQGVDDYDVGFWMFFS